MKPPEYDFIKTQSHPLDEVIELLTPKEVFEFMGHKIEVVSWMPKNAIAMRDSSGQYHLIAYLGNEDE